METFGIGEVARRVGVRPSAVRYYEARGLIEPFGRTGGKRVYGQEAVERMALISFAKAVGFSLAEIRKLLAGFPHDTPAGARWSELASAKLIELDAMSQRIDVMRAALRKISECGCSDLDQCAHSIGKISLSFSHREKVPRSGG
ncbi:MAG TPA: MerR family transcriptional regulator [Thermoanaerobaculia bacterium]|jgi:MerR family redox-sensitive transcriptional activator SoxR